MAHYEDMFQQIQSSIGHKCAVQFYYLDVPLEETKVRHSSREKSTLFGPELLDDWYSSAQRTDYPNETVFSKDMPAATMVESMMAKFNSI